MHPIFKLSIATALLALAACSSKPQSTTAEQNVANNDMQSSPAAVYHDERDPFESFNRSMWTFNYDYLDEYILRPATVGYIAVVPKPARTGLANLVNNLNEPANFINGLLQGKPKHSAISAGRFLVNSTVGLVGLIDVATPMGLDVKEEDFGQSLGVWGVGQGPFLMIPARGPTTIRNLTGDVVDNLYFPMSVLNTPQTIAKFTIGALSGREALMAQEKLLNDSLDPYAFVKDAYFQRQEYQLYDGNPPEQAVDEAALEEFLE
jgi:phospholipid-binding lipoprotein MlaA